MDILILCAIIVHFAFTTSNIYDIKRRMDRKWGKEPKKVSPREDL